MKDMSLKPAFTLGPGERAGVLLPLPLAGAYDYKLPRWHGGHAGLVVVGAFGHRAKALGVVWGKAEGAVGDNRLKEAVPLEGEPILPAGLCDFIDWVAQYTLTPPGLVLAMALRSRQAFEAEVPRIAYVKGGTVPQRLTPPRQRVLDVASDGLARSVPAIGGRRQCDARRGARADRGGRADAKPSCRNSRRFRSPIPILPHLC